MAEQMRDDQLAAARAAVEQTVSEHMATAHRALDRTYNLLRVSERRWAIVRIHNVTRRLRSDVAWDDVITFEQVTGPLAWDDAVEELVRRRAKKG